MVCAVRKLFVFFNASAPRSVVAGTLEVSGAAPGTWVCALGSHRCELAVPGAGLDNASALVLAADASCEDQDRGIRVTRTGLETYA